MSPRPRRPRTALAVAPAAALLAACAESPLTARRPGGDAGSAPIPVVPLPADGVRATLALVDSAAGSATVVVSLDARGLDVGAYQGLVTYDRDALDLVSAGAVAPAAGVGGGGTRLANPSSVGEAGAVRFAGFSGAGAVVARGGDRVARLEFRVRDWRAVAALRVTLEAAGAVDGRAVAATGLVAGARVVSALGAGRETP